MDIQLIKVLLAWAIYLSPSYGEAPLPIVIEKPHSFFVENACGGKECNVYGWYNNDGVIFLDEKLNQRALDQILIHEIVHYLQDRSKDWDNSSCKHRNLREMEAYLVQIKYSVNYAGYLPLRMSIPRACKEEQNELKLEHHP